MYNVSLLTRGTQRQFIHEEIPHSSIAGSIRNISTVIDGVNHTLRHLVSHGVHRLYCRSAVFVPRVRVVCRAAAHVIVENDTSGTIGWLRAWGGQIDVWKYISKQTIQSINQSINKHINRLLPNHKDHIHISNTSPPPPSLHPPVLTHPVRAVH